MDARRTRIGRIRWTALGAGLTAILGSGGLLTASAAVGSGERAVFQAITPCRLLDTRPGTDNVGSRATPLGPNTTYTVIATGRQGNCDLPADALAIAANVAAIDGSADSYLTVFAADSSPRPVAATLNWVARQPPVSNATTADLSAAGAVSFYNYAGTVHLAVDVVGYWVGHHHDDRYYTRAEVDQKIAANPGPAGPKGDKGDTGDTGAPGPAATVIREDAAAVVTIPAGTAEPVGGNISGDFGYTVTTTASCQVTFDVQVDAAAAAPVGSAAQMTLFYTHALAGTVNDDHVAVPTHVVSNGATGPQPVATRTVVFTVTPHSPVVFGARITSVDPAWRTGASTLSMVGSYNCA